MFSFRLKLFLLLFLFGIILISTSAFLFFKLHDSALRTNALENTARLSHALDRSIGVYFQDIKNVLNVIDKSLAFKSYLSTADRKSQSDTENLLMSLASASEDYMQIRYIDKSGMEKMKVERSKQGASVFISKQESLRSQLSRGCFQKGLTVSQLFRFSKIFFNDPNIERPQKPYEPLIMAIKQVHHNGDLKGLLVLNVSIKRFLRQLVDIPDYRVFIIDKMGRYVVHPDHDNDWNDLVSAKYRLEEEFGEASACILNNVECQTESIYARDISTIVNSDNLKLIIQARSYQPVHQPLKHLSDVFIITLLLSLLAYILAYWASLTPMRLMNEIAGLHAEIDKRIEEKLLVCKSTNDRLAKNVKQRTKELELLNNKLHKQVNRDYLTKILNRRYFFEMSDRYLQVSHRKRQFLSFILFDIDHFKVVNDRYGHDEGDRLLVFLAQRISSILRDKDIFGRISGEEFAIAILDMDYRQVREFAEKLRLFIQDSLYVNDAISIKVTISMGVSQAEENEQDVSVIISRADLNLYQAKKAGGNQVVLDSSGL